MFTVWLLLFAQSLPPYIGQNGITNEASLIPNSLPGGCLSPGLSGQLTGLRLSGAGLEWQQGGKTKMLEVRDADEEKLRFTVPKDATEGMAEIVVVGKAGRSNRALVRVGPGCLGLGMKRGREGNTTIDPAFYAAGTIDSKKLRLVVNGLSQPLPAKIAPGLQGSAYLVNPGVAVSNVVRLGKPARLAPWMEALGAERGRVELQVEDTERRSGFGGVERKRLPRLLTRKIVMQEQPAGWRDDVPDLGQCTTIYGHSQSEKSVGPRDIESWVGRLQGQDWGQGSMVAGKENGSALADLTELKRVVRGKDLELRWKPVAGEAWLVLQNVDTLTTASATTLCRASAKDGRYVVGGDWTRNFPASSGEGPPVDIVALLVTQGDRVKGADGLTVYKVKSSTHVWRVRYE